MLSISNLSGSGSDLSGYFEKESAQKDYWSKEAQEASQWQGQGAAAMGLTGPVDQAKFEQIMDGILPDGTQMPGGQGGVRRMGYDLTFSAPKSVSLQGLVAGDKRVIEAHDQAVTRAMNWLQDNAAQTQIKSGGEIRIEKTDNLVAAVFRHETSRELDPQLHSHAVVANLTRSEDGQWRALDNSEIYKLRMTAGAIYRAELAHELKQQGYGVHQTTADGRFELDGYTKAQLDAFSTRRQQIEASLDERGLAGAKASEQAALMTRRSKQSLDAGDRQELESEWKARADSLGVKVSPDPEKAILSDSVASASADAAVKHAVDHLSERQSTFQARFVRQHAIQAAVGNARISDVDKAFDRAVESGNLIKLERDGEVRFATATSLAREINTLDIEQKGRGASQPITREGIEKHLDGLNDGQRESARLILTSTDKVIGVQGRAGTGKTFMLNRVNQAAEEAGWKVLALAPTASAAQTLGAEIGADGQTLAGHLQRNIRSAKKELWVIDEAGLVGGKDMQRLFQKAERTGAKVALIGDTRQLRGVAAGMPFHALQQGGMKTAEMTEVMRHKSDDLKQVVDMVRQGKAQEAISMMKEGRGASLDVAPGRSREERLETAVDKYMEARKRGSALLVAELRVDRADLNQMVRDKLIERGEISRDGTSSSILISKDLTRAEAKLPHAYERGDVIEFGREYRSLNIAKGERLTVAEIDHKRGSVALENEHGQRVNWHPAKNSKATAYTREEAELAKGDTIAWTRNDHASGRRNGELATVLDIQSGKATVQMADGSRQSLDLNKSQHLDHAHAVTVYKSQGRTTDHVIIASETQSRESAYVAISRAREGADMVVNSAERQESAIGREQEPDNALDWLNDLQPLGGEHQHQGNHHQEHHQHQEQHQHEQHNQEHEMER